MTMLDDKGTARTGSLGEVFGVAFPLIISSGTFALKLFSDRLMTAWYSDTAIAAAIAAGMVAFMLTSFFMGVANYANAFVAQYSGAERHDRTGLSVWQSMLFSLAAGLFIVAAGVALSPAFAAIGHHPLLASMEEGYFTVLTCGAGFALLNSSIMCFWTGRNKTWVVVAVSGGSIVLNVIMNWAFIFGAAGSRQLASYPPPLRLLGDGLNAVAGVMGLPATGAVGAGFATIGTDAMSFLVFLALFLLPGNRREFGTWPAKVFNPSLMRRMIRYGFGNGMQLFLDVGAFAVFNILMGMYAIVEGANVAAASGIAVSVNGVAFVPMLGVGAAAAILVGQGIGAGDVGFASNSVKNAKYLIFGYMICMCLLFEVFPEFLIDIFAPSGHMTPATIAMAIDFLRFAGVFCIADGFFILYGSAIRGAGDTKFSMWAMAVLGWCFFAIPCLAAYGLGAGPYALWSIIVFYVLLSAAVFLWRYRQGKWKTMKVIEETGSQRLHAKRESVRIVPVITPESEIEVVEVDEQGNDGQDED